MRSKLGKEELLNIVIGGFRKENILKTFHNPGKFRTEKRKSEFKLLCIEMYYALNYIFK